MGDSYEAGETVHAACYPELLALQITNPSSDAWVGRIEYSANGSGERHTAFHCLDCSASSKASKTTELVVDGDDDGEYDQATRCVDGAKCTLQRTGQTPYLRNCCK